MQEIKVEELLKAALAILPRLEKLRQRDNLQDVLMEFVIAIVAMPTRLTPPTTRDSIQPSDIRRRVWPVILSLYGLKFFGTGETW